MPELIHVVETYLKRYHMMELVVTFVCHPLFNSVKPLQSYGKSRAEQNKFICFFAETE